MKTIDKILENNYKNMNGYGDNGNVRKNSLDNKNVIEIENKTDKEIKQDVSTTKNSITQPKNSMQSLLRDEDYKKVPDNSNNQNNQQSSNNSSMITFKMDPNSNDLKDMKVNVNMDGETAYRLYQENKKYLPTTQQVISGVKATANLAEKTANSVNKDDTNMVTGNKSQNKSKDPLTSLFGGGAKKKGMF